MPKREETKVDPVEAGIAKWVDDNLRNTSFSRDTEAWNHFQAALPALASAIKAEMGETE